MGTDFNKLWIKSEGEVTNDIVTDGDHEFLGAVSAFDDDSSHFCINESKRGHRPLSHIQHQGGTKAGDAEAIFLPNARIHDSSGATRQQLEPQSLGSRVAVRI